MPGQTQRAVWLMANAFFVFTGRSRRSRQWASPALQGQLDYTGSAAWPGLSVSVGSPATDSL